MNSSCYSCRESIKQLKLHKKYIYKKHYDRTSVDDISIFFPEIPLPMVFDKFKKSLRAGILKGIFECRLRRLIYYFRLDFVLGTFPTRSRRQGTKHRKTHYVRVVCATSRCSNCGLPVPRRVITIFLDGGCCWRSLRLKLMELKSKVLVKLKWRTIYYSHEVGKTVKMMWLNRFKCVRY